MVSPWKAALLLFSLEGALGWTIHARGTTLRQPPLSRAARYSPPAKMGVMEIIRNLFYGESKSGDEGAGSTARHRLRVVLASDRTGLDEATMEKIRLEIKEVVSK